jgi:ubiquinone/menaquinone biosynthesis C-methylase UbiE
MERLPEGEAISEMEDARRFSQVMSNRLVQHEYRRLARDVVEMGLPTGAKVLDVGTGPGFVAIEIARLLSAGDYQVIGLDLSRSMLAVAAQNAQREGLDGALTWREGDAKALPFEDGEFDFVVSSGSLHHWEDPLRVFDEVARVLKGDGGCIIRDSKRLQRWAPRLFAWTIGLTIPPDFRVHYWNSIKSSYTRPELETMLGRSQLKGWRILEDLMDVMILKERTCSHHLSRASSNDTSTTTQTHP